jgi:hypothetical protein
MKEEKIESLKQELKSHITPLIFNGVMSISQILILISFLSKFNGLMIFGLVGIGFGTGLNSHSPCPRDLRYQTILKIIYRWRINHINPLEN